MWFRFLVIVFFVVGSAQLMLISGCNAPEDMPTAQPPRRKVEINGPRDYLGAVGTKNVDIIQIAFPHRFGVLTQKMKQAQAENPAPFFELISRAQPGQPLPYDPILGLTRAEYEECLELSKQIGAKKAGNGRIKIAGSNSDDPNVFKIDGLGNLEALMHVEVDFDKDTVEVSGTTLSQSSEIHTDDSMFGAWDGVHWQQVNQLGKIEFSIGVLRDTGRYLISYEVRKLPTQGKEAEKIDLWLIHD